MTNLAEAQRELEDARREKTELDDLIEGLEQQVLDGNEAQATRELGEKFGLQRLAELRQERAEKRVQDAEIARRAQLLKDAQEDATEALTAVSADVVAGAYVAALAAVTELVEACRTREAAILEHARALRSAGDTQLLVATGDARRIIDVNGERFEAGRFEAGLMLGRVAGAAMATAGRSASGSQFQRPEGLHPVEQLLAAAAGEDASALEVNWSSTQFAARMVAFAQAATKAEAVA